MAQILFFFLTTPIWSEIPSEQVIKYVTIIFHHNITYVFLLCFIFLMLVYVCLVCSCLESREVIVGILTNKNQNCYLVDKVPTTKDNYKTQICLHIKGQNNKNYCGYHYCDIIIMKHELFVIFAGVNYKTCALCMLKTQNFRLILS